jgi:hypothetical protein
MPGSDTVVLRLGSGEARFQAGAARVVRMVYRPEYAEGEHGRLPATRSDAGRRPRAPRPRRGLIEAELGFVAH